MALFPVNTGSVGNTNVDSNFPVNMHMHSGTVDAAKVAAPVSDSLSLKEDGSSRKVRFCDPIRRVFNTLQSSLLWRCKGRNGVARSRSVQCLMRDCPVMSADETFRDWYI